MDEPNSTISPLYKGGVAAHSPAPMTFLATNFLDISITLLTVIFVIVCLLMTLLILMQRPKQEGLGAAFGGGVTDQVFGARTTNVLQKGTVYTGSLFFVIALTLAILISHKSDRTKVVDDEKPAIEEEQSEPTPESPSVEEVLPKSLIEELEDSQPAEEPIPEEESSEDSETAAPEGDAAPADESTEEPKKES